MNLSKSVVHPKLHLERHHEHCENIDRPVGPSRMLGISSALRSYGLTSKSSAPGIFVADEMDLVVPQFH